MGLKRNISIDELLNSPSGMMDIIIQYPLVSQKLLKVETGRTPLVIRETFSQPLPEFPCWFGGSFLSQMGHAKHLVVLFGGVLSIVVPVQWAAQRHQTRDLTLHYASKSTAPYRRWCHISSYYIYSSEQYCCCLVALLFKSSS